MIFKILTWAVLLGLFGTQISCKRQRLTKSETSTNKNAADSTQITAGESGSNAKKTIVQPAELDFDYLKLKSKVAINSPKLSQTFPATIQIKKDSIIWISVSIGLEVARGIITPDSAIFLDRFNRNVYRFNFRELSQLLQFDISYDLLQSLLVGNMPVYVREEDAVSTTSGFVNVKQRVGDLTLENTIDEVINKLTELIARKADNPNRLMITYGDFTDTEKGKLPQRISTKVENSLSPDDVLTSINVEHSKVEFLSGDIRFPFSVPNSYNEVKLPKK